jgi:hypothetical protein
LEVIIAAAETRQGSREAVSAAANAVQMGAPIEGALLQERIEPGELLRALTFDDDPTLLRDVTHATTPS